MRVAGPERTEAEDEEAEFQRLSSMAKFRRGRKRRRCFYIAISGQAMQSALRTVESIEDCEKGLQRHLIILSSCPETV